MARVAIVTAGHVVGRLARGNGAVVAGTAAALYLSVVNSCGWSPHAGRMTGLAVGRAQYMRGRLARRRSAVVTRRAAIGDARMVESGRPSSGRMTTIAGRSGRYMRSRLANGNGAVVAESTAALHLRVVYTKRRSEGIRRMASLADQRRGHMAGILADCRSPVVAG
jgi:hypothetical protein